MKAPILRGTVLALLLLTAACGAPAATPTAAPAAATAPPAAGTGTAAPAATNTPAPAATAGTAAHTPGALTRVVVAMGYIPNVQFAPFYLAEDRGYYAAEGLAVEFKYGQVNDLLKVVSTGAIDFANVSGDEMVPAVAQGIPVRYVLTQYYRYPIAAAAIGATVLKSPADLKGQTIGIPGPYGSTYIGLRALLQAANLQESDVHEQSIGFTQVAAVLNHQVPIAMVYSMNEPEQLRASGQQVSLLQVADYENLAAVGLATSLTKLQQDPAQVRGFVRATLHGISDTVADPDAAFASSLKRMPELAADQQPLQRAVLTATLPFMTPPAGRKPGSSDPQTWQTTESFLRSIGLSSQAIDPTTLWTNDYLP